MKVKLNQLAQNELPGLYDAYGDLQGDISATEMRDGISYHTVQFPEVEVNGIEAKYFDTIESDQ